MTSDKRYPVQYHGLYPLHGTLHALWVCIAPHTGEVKVWAGDINFQSWKYDRCFQASARLYLQTLCLYGSHEPGIIPLRPACGWKHPREVEEKMEKRNSDALTMPMEVPLDTMSLKMAFCPIGQHHCCQHSPWSRHPPDSHHRTPWGIQTKLKKHRPSAWELLTYRYWAGFATAP